MKPRKFRIVCYNEKGEKDQIIEFIPTYTKDYKFNRATQDIFNTMLYYDRVEITQIEM